MVDTCTCPVCGASFPCTNCSQTSTVDVTPVQVQPAETLADFEVWVDVYQGNTGTDYKVLAQNGVAGIIAKAGYGYNNAGSRGSAKDKQFKYNIEQTLKYGMKAASYWWNHPTEDWNRQVNTYLDQIKGMPLSFAAVDIEQAEGYVWVLNKKKTNYIWARATLSSTQISAAGSYMCELLDKALNIPIAVYTSTWFISGNSPKIAEWLPKYWTWLASYPSSHIYTCDKKEAEAKGFTYCATWQEYFSKYAPKPTQIIALPRGISKWKLWQFSGDRVKLPGSQSYMDLNWFRKK